MESCFTSMQVVREEGFEAVEELFWGWPEFGCLLGELHQLNYKPSKFTNAPAALRSHLRCSMW